MASAITCPSVTLHTEEELRKPQFHSLILMNNSSDSNMRKAIYLFLHVPTILAFPLRPTQA